MLGAPASKLPPIPKDVRGLEKQKKKEAKQKAKETKRDASRGLNFQFPNAISRDPRENKWNLKDKLFHYKQGFGIWTHMSDTSELI